MSVTFPSPARIGEIDLGLFAEYPDTPHRRVPFLRSYIEIVPTAPPIVTRIASEVLGLTCRKLGPHDSVAYSTYPVLPNRAHVPTARRLHIDQVAPFYVTSSLIGAEGFSGFADERVLENEGHVNPQIIEVAKQTQNVQRITDELYAQAGGDQRRVDEVLLEAGTQPFQLGPGEVADISLVSHRSPVAGLEVIEAEVARLGLPLVGGGLPEVTRTYVGVAPLY